MKYAALSFLFWILISACVTAQYRADSTLFQVETKDGNLYTGYLIGQENDKILLDTKTIGIIHIQKSQIHKMETVDNNSKHRTSGRGFGFLPPAYFNLPNSYSLERGKGYYKNTWIFMNHASFGVTDHFSIGAGVIPIFLFGGSESPIWLTPKFSMPIVEDKLNIGVTGIIGGVAGVGGVFSLINPTATLGSPNRNVTGGLAFGYANGTLYKVPIFTLSGMYRTGKRFVLMSENYLGDGGGLIFIGGRSLFSSVNLDYGLMIPLNVGVYVGIPWLGVTIPFSK